MQHPKINEKMKRLKSEIETIKNANREYRKVKHPGYPAQRLNEASAHPTRSDSAGDQDTAENVTIGHNTPSETAVWNQRFPGLTLESLKNRLKYCVRTAQERTS